MTSLLCCLLPPRQVILVRSDEAKRRLLAEHPSFRGKLLTVREAKGLEFTDVCLLDFFRVWAGSVIHTIMGCALASLTLLTPCRCNRWVDGLAAAAAGLLSVGDGVASAGPVPAEPGHVEGRGSAQGGGESWREQHGP